MLQALSENCPAPLQYVGVATWYTDVFLVSYVSPCVDLSPSGVYVCAHVSRCVSGVSPLEPYDVIIRTMSACVLMLVVGAYTSTLIRLRSCEKRLRLKPHASILHKFKSNNLPTRPRDAEAGEGFSIMHQSFVHNDCVSRIGVSHSVSVRARPRVRTDIVMAESPQSQIAQPGPRLGPRAEVKSRPQLPR